MQLRRHQRGITFWGLCFVLSVLAFFLFLSFKLFPPYMEDFKVRAALDSLARQPDIGSLGRPEIVTALDKRFQIDDINAVKPNDVIVELRGRTKVIRIQYDSVIPIIGNLSVLLEFDHVKQVRAGE